MPLVSDSVGMRKMLDAAWGRGWALEVDVVAWGALGDVLGAGDGDAFTVPGDGCCGVVSRYGEAWALKAIVPPETAMCMSNAEWMKLEKPDEWVTVGKLNRKPGDKVEPGDFVIALVGKEVLLGEVWEVGQDGKASKVRLGAGTQPIDAGERRWLLCSKWPLAAHYHFQKQQCLFPAYLHFMQRMGKRQKELEARGWQPGDAVTPKRKVTRS
jgi:hypothetical protein